MIVLSLNVLCVSLFHTDTLVTSLWLQKWSVNVKGIMLNILSWCKHLTRLIWLHWYTDMSFYFVDCIIDINRNYVHGYVTVCSMKIFVLYIDKIISDETNWKNDIICCRCNDIADLRTGLCICNK
jgi:hypothetical protein